MDKKCRLAGTLNGLLISCARSFPKRTEKLIKNCKKTVKFYVGEINVNGIFNIGP